MGRESSSGFIMSSSFMILSVNVSPMSGAGAPSEYLFMAILGSTVAIQVAPRSHYPDGGRLATYSSRELRNSAKRTAQHYKESLVIIGAAL